MNKLALLILAVLCTAGTGCQFYRPGQISQKVFGGIADNKSTLVIPTPYGPAYRIGDSTNKMEIRHPNGTVIILNDCQREHKVP